MLSVLILTYRMTDFLARSYIVAIVISSWMISKLQYEPAWKIVFCPIQCPQTTCPQTACPQIQRRVFSYKWTLRFELFFATWFVRVLWFCSLHCCMVVDVRSSRCFGYWPMKRLLALEQSNELTRVIRIHDQLASTVIAAHPCHGMVMKDTLRVPSTWCKPKGLLAYCTFALSHMGLAIMELANKPQKSVWFIAFGACTSLIPNNPMIHYVPWTVSIALATFQPELFDLETAIHRHGSCWQLHLISQLVASHGAGDCSQWAELEWGSRNPGFSGGEQCPDVELKVWPTPCLPSELRCTCCVRGGLKGTGDQLWLSLWVERLFSF